MSKVSVIALCHPELPDLFLHGLRRDNQKWCLPGGHANSGETSRETATRELQEETGLMIKEMEQARNGEFPSEGLDPVKVTLFMATAPKDLTLDTSNDPDAEFTEFKFLNPHHIEKAHIPKEKNILVQYLSEKSSLNKSRKVDYEDFGADEYIHHNYKFKEVKHPYTPEGHKAFKVQSSKGKAEIMFAKDHGQLASQLTLMHRKQQKTLIKAEDLIKDEEGRKKQLGKMVSNDPSHQKAVDFAAKIPNINWGTWFMRNYKQDPQKTMHSETISNIQHHVNMSNTHPHHYQGIVFDKTHGLDAGMSKFKEAESKAQDAAGDKTRMIPAYGTKKIDLGNGWGWHDLNTNECEKEGEAMGHCATTEGSLWSLRREQKVGNKLYHEPYITAGIDNGVLGEVKGRANQKPNPKYHDAIKKLMMSNHVRVVDNETTYAAESNFLLNDVPENELQEMIDKKPSLVIASKTHYHKLQEKHHAQLANDKESYVRNAMAGNPNIHHSVHAQLANDENSYVRSSMAGNPNVHHSLHAQLANDKESYVRRVMALNPNIHHSLHAQLANDKESYVRSSMAKNPNVHHSLHAQLANDENFYVRSSMAGNPNVHHSVHAQLANDEDSDVRRVMALNPNIHHSLHAQLANDKESYVRSSMAKNPNVHHSVHAQLANDENFYVRSSMAGNPNVHHSVHAQLANDEDSDVRRVMAGNPNVHHSLHAQLANDENFYVRNAMAKNPNVHHSLHAQLANDENSYVRNAMAGNPNYNPNYKPEKLAASQKLTINLNKSTNGDWEKEGYKISSVTSRLTDYRICAYDKDGNNVGYLLLDRKPTESRHLNVYQAGIGKGHTGKGLYKKMLSLATEHAKSKGLKGIVSDGSQRSSDATRAWKKVATRADCPKKSDCNGQECLHAGKTLYLEKAESLEKAERPPMRTGEIHPAKPYVGDVLHGRLAWRHNDKQAKVNDEYIKRSKVHFLNHVLNKWPPEHKKPISDFFNWIQNHSTRHFVPAEDHEYSRNYVPRARHLAGVLKAFDPRSAEKYKGYGMMYSKEDNTYKMIAPRHDTSTNQITRVDVFNWHPQRGFIGSKSHVPQEAKAKGLIKTEDLILGCNFEAL